MIGEVARWHGYERLKEEQLSAIEKFVCGQDVFVSLPTGFRKSVIYGILPTMCCAIEERVWLRETKLTQQQHATCIRCLHVRGS